MKTYVGRVTSNVDKSRSGELMVAIPRLYKGVPQPVTYTSPFYQVNAGGMVTIPEKGDQVLVLHNENPLPGESNFYYQATVVRAAVIEGGKKSNDKFVPIRSNDPKAQIYGENSKPVTQTFTNSTGAGLYIQREFTKSQIKNNVTLKAEGGTEVNVGPLGLQMRNEDGDCIILNGPEPNDAYGARSLVVETFNSQIYKCIAGNIDIRLTQGGDINIENTSFGLYSLPPWFGNVRIKSKYKDISLVTTGPTGKVNIVTNGTQVQIDAFGGVKIVTPGSIDFQAAQDINIQSTAGSVNIVGALGANLGSPLNTNIDSGTQVAINGQKQDWNAGPPGVPFTNSTPIPYPGPVRPVTPPVITPNDYGDPVGGVG